MKQRIAIVQRDIIWRDVEANLKALEKIFQSIWVILKQRKKIL